MTQHEKIIELYKTKADNDGYVCQIEFWNSYIRSPHKRRGELEALGYEFTPRACEHGQKRSFDYKMVKIEVEKPASLSFVYKVHEPITKFNMPL